MFEIMGQTASDVVPARVKDEFRRVHTVVKRDFDIVKKEAILAKDVVSLDSQNLRASIAELNGILSSCCRPGDQRVLFGLRIVDEESYLWKTNVRILCFKINIAQRSVTVARSMNLHQFWRLRGSLIKEMSLKRILENNIDGQVIDGFEFVEHPASIVTSTINCEIERETPQPDTNQNYPNNCEHIEAILENDNGLSVSTVFARVDDISPMPNEDECIICMDNRSEVTLPCAHSFCRNCIETWSGEHQSCPTCRNTISENDEFWEITERPDISNATLIDEMNNRLLRIATGS